jgi:hypothetical protein
MLTLPRNLIGCIANVQAGPKLLKHRGRKVIGEDVSVLRCCRNMKYPNVAEGDPLPNTMEINLNVLRPLMLNWVAGEINSTNIVTVDQGGTARQVVPSRETN